MGRTQIPPQPPMHRGGQDARAHEICHAGGACQAAAHCAIQSPGILPARTVPPARARPAAAAVPAQGTRSCPRNRADGWLHRP